MHLKAIKLRGFKSFVDPVEIHLEPGVAVVVGPNGSGKSNVSDSILWATGSMSPGELRAEKPDDVLFSGSVGRQPTDFCEVDLLFDNADGEWPDLPYSEVSVARRLNRGGEGQYLVNKTPVRRIDLVELLSDVGLGGGLRSVISQGRVETVLNSKPSERRELIEEAAGLGRFKRRRHRAELKLARVAIAGRPRTRSRGRGQEAASSARAPGDRSRARREARRRDRAACRRRSRRSTSRASAERRAEAEGRRAETAEERAALDLKINALVAERESAEEELTDSAGAREQATAALYRLRSGGERIALRRESAASLSSRSAPSSRRLAAHDPSASVGLEAAARDASTAAQSAAAERARLQVEAEGRWARIAATERAAQSTLAAELDDVLARRAETESQLTGGGRDALLALRGATQTLGVRHESAQRLLSELQSELPAARRVPAGPSPADLGRLADDADAAARTRCRNRKISRLASASRGNASSRSSSRLRSAKGLPPAARALAEEGEQLALQQIEVEAGAERSTAAALGHRASAVLAAHPARALELIEKANAAGLGRCSCSSAATRASS